LLSSNQNGQHADLKIIEFAQFIIIKNKQTREGRDNAEVEGLCPKVVFFGGEKNWQKVC